MDSKRCMVAACNYLMERKSKVLVIATFATVVLLGVVSAAPPSQNGIDAEISLRLPATCVLRVAKKPSCRSGKSVLV